MDLGVIIKDEDLEARTPLRSHFSSDFGSSEHGNEEVENATGRQTNVSIYQITSQDGQRSSRLRKHHETAE